MYTTRSIPRPLWPKFGAPPTTVRMAETIPTSVVVCGLPEAGRLHVQQRDGEAATLHDVYATGSLLCALPAQPDEELVAQLPLLVSAPADRPITHHWAHACAVSVATVPARWRESANCTAAAAVLLPNDSATC